jgi:membrane protease YdiL (CAAX protease family)
MVTFGKDRVDMCQAENQPPSAPSFRLSLAIYALAMVLMLILSTVLAVSGHMSLQLGIGLELLAQWGFVFVPLVLLLWLGRYNVRKSLYLSVPKRPALIATLLMAPSSCILLQQMHTWQTILFPMPEELNAMVEAARSLAQTRTGLALLLSATVLSPPVCEELLYRGILLSSLRRRWGPLPSTIVVALLFSLAHLHPYRVVLTAILSVLLTYVVLRSASIYLSMLFHFIVNGLSIILLLRLHEPYIPFLRYTEEKGFAPSTLIVSLFLFIAGVVVLERHAKASPPRPH